MKDKKNIKIALISIFGYDFGNRYISSFLRENGYPTYIISFGRKRYSPEFLGNDYFNARLLNHEIYCKNGISLLVGLLKRLDVRIVGISFTSVTFQIAKRIAEEIKKNLDVVVVVGGIHAILSPEECLGHADIACIGEGEYPMLELADKIRLNEPLSGIKNLWIKCGKGTEKNELRPLIDKLDRLPFPDFVDINNKFLIDCGELGEDHALISAHENNVYPIMTSRGCLYSCSFCCNSVLRQRYKGKGNYLRRRSVDNVISELKYVVQNRCVNSIRFWDDIFTFDSEWVDEFSSKYPKEIGKPFSCYAHPKFTNKDILFKLKRCGLDIAFVGIQSGSESMSKVLYSRVQSNHDLLEFAYNMKSFGVTVRYDLIADNPYELARDQELTVELLMQLPYPYMIQIYSLCWFPETPLTNKALGEKIIAQRDLEQYTSKALNNFHMYIPLSKDNYSVFWNCIKGMAVNRSFPISLVRFCMSNGFFIKYPKVLFYLGKFYLILLSRFDVNFYQWKVIFKREIPLNRTPSIIYLKPINLSRNFIIDSAKWLFHKPEMDCSLFFDAHLSNNKLFLLRVRNNTKKQKQVRLVVVLRLFDKHRSDSNKRTLWLMKFSLDCKQKDISIELNYPNLTYRINCFNFKAKLLNKGISEYLCQTEKYLIEIKDAGKPYMIKDNILVGCKVSDSL